MIPSLFIALLLPIHVTVSADPLGVEPAVENDPLLLSPVAAEETPTSANNSAPSTCAAPHTNVSRSITVTLPGLPDGARPLDLVLIPAGSFQMGTQGGTRFGEAAPQPQGN